MNNKKSLILLVDDNPANLIIGKNVLAGKYSVATASSTEKMFSLLESNSPAMILLDIDMPQMDGYEAIKILKSKPASKDIPVIFLSARNKPDDKQQGLSLGAVDYVVKPFQPSLLLERIEAYLAAG
jgi:CheY-like chemotaxis protein